MEEFPNEQNALNIKENEKNTSFKPYKTHLEHKARYDDVKLIILGKYTESVDLMLQHDIGAS